MTPDPATRSARYGVILAMLLGGIAMCWILLTPPGAGPDEPDHLVRAGALAHGRLEGSDIGSSRSSGFEVPVSYRLPDEECYAFRPSVPVACAADPAPAEGSVVLPSSADEYPIWGHLLGGLLSRLPGVEPIWWARIGTAAVAIALSAAAATVAWRQRAVAAGATLVALTPMSWGTFALVNPSSMAIGGAIALWSALLFGAERAVSTRWLTALGWAALVLPRRDGPIWACIIVTIALVGARRSLIDWARGLGRGPGVVVVGSTLATMVWGLTSGSRVTRLVVLAPVALVAVEVFRRLWARRESRAARSALAGVATLAILVFVAVVMATRPGGWDRDLATRVVEETGNNLIEAIGVLGWLDTTLPTLAIGLVCVALGALAAASLSREFSAALWSVMLLGCVFLTSWLFELAQGNTTGTYWQGRYSLPLLVGIPLFLGTAHLPRKADGRVAVMAGGASVLAMNAAAWAAARRWGVGTDGSLLPWDWDTWGAPLPPVAVLLILAVLSGALVLLLWWSVSSGPSRQER